MKKIYLLATALAALVSCTSDDFTGEKEPLDANGKAAISFDFDVPTPTRASGVEAATALGNQFIVYGEKGSITAAAPTAGNYVFPNYQVNYVNNSSYTTTSNTTGWEYVGYTHSTNYQSNITTKATTEATAVQASNAAQTIKYWDYGAENYIFTAVSALGADIEAGRVKIQKNEFGTTAYDKGYTITLAKVSEVYPTVNKLYFADRNVITKETGSDRTTPNAYGGNVTFNFRNLVSHIRAGIYETIPGYDISDITFYVDNGSGEQTDLAQVNSTDAFGAKCPNISTTNYEGTITVTYYSNSDTEGNENQPKVTATGTSATNLILGTNISSISTTTLLGKTATNPTWDTSTGTFTEVFPQINNTTSLKLKCNYTLWNSVTHETITVDGATAEVPADYLKWKPNYKYTYLFKISDNTNGQTGETGPAGLYPITFDAVEIVAADGTAEYITTVSEPSITTFGVKSGKYVTGKEEYEAGSDIYATFTEGSTVKTPTFSGSGEQHVNVFSVVSKDPTKFKVTEASVAEAIANPGLITNSVYTCTVNYTIVSAETTLADGTNYYKADSESRIPGATGYVPTLAVAGTDYTVGATTRNVDVYTCSVTDVTEVTDPTTLAAGTTYYKKYGDIAPGSDGYVVTIAAEGTDYEVAPVITATTITSENYSTYFTAVPTAVTSVPAEDGTTKNIDALKLTGVNAGTYAIEYEASAAWTGTTYKKVYKVIVVQ